MPDNVHGKYSILYEPSEMFFSDLRSLQERLITPIPDISPSVMSTQQDVTALIQAQSDAYVFLLSAMQSLTLLQHRIELCPHRRYW